MHGPYLWLVPAGFVIGAYGTLIGAGGGFILVPFLLLLYPALDPEIITSTSLAVVFFNALSGTVAYARMGRVDYRSGLIFSAATVPGAIVGALTTAYIPRRTFDAILGAVMVIGSAYLMKSPAPGRGDGSPPRHVLHRRVVEADGTVQTYTYNPVLGFGISIFVGYFSSVLGIGGGIIHVPVLTNVLHFPVHVATATSHFTLVVMTLTGSFVHLFTGTLRQTVWRAIPLAVGVVAGAQLGARLSSRIRGPWIIRALALALGLAGIRLVYLVL
jgi:uncharacterized membrane protein YfcA